MGAMEGFGNIMESQKKKFKGALADRDEIMRQLYKNERAKLTEELDAMKKERDEAIMRRDGQIRANDELRKEQGELKSQLEQVKKERDSLRGTATKSWIALNFERNEHKKVRDQLSEVTRQRDEAADLLREYGRVKPDHEEVAWHKRYIAFIRSLSSGGGVLNLPIRARHAKNAGL